MRVAEFARDLAGAPSSEDAVVVSVDGTDYEIGAVQFEAGKVTLLTAENAPDPASEPVALAEQTALDQEILGEDGQIPGHADVMNRVATGEGIASDLRDGDVKTEPEKDATWNPHSAGSGQEYNAGPEQPTVPVEEEQVSDDSGT